MIPKNIKIKGYTKKNRHEMIDYVVNCISKCSGWVLNHTMFSNTSICINFEIKASGVSKLLKQLNKNGLNLNKESIELRESFPENLEESYRNKIIMGTVNITFIHNDPDLKITVPSVPG
jgi:transcriptional regulator